MVRREAVGADHRMARRRQTWRMQESAGSVCDFGRDPAVFLLKSPLLCEVSVRSVRVDEDHTFSSIV